MITLKLGTSDPDVLYLQKFLGQDIDGIVGDKTQKALKDWQKKKGLIADGICGPNTWQMILDETRDSKITENSWKSLANKLGCDPIVLKAIKQVETGSKGAFDASDRPAILFEAHLFWRNLQGVGKNPSKYYPSHTGILSKSWNRSLYKGGVKEWARLREAWGISRRAAIMSASYGFPQILGQNFKDPFSFVAGCYMSEEEQLGYFCKFLEGNGFIPYLKSKNWAMIAKKYNGPAYAKNAYDRKLEQAYKKLGGK